MLTRRAHLYAFVYPLFWPWLWLQLWRLQAWIDTHHRDVLFRIDRFGNLTVTCISDAPRDPSLYHYDAPACPAWADPGLACDTPVAFLESHLPAAAATAAPCHACSAVCAPAAPDTS
ncbi:hypothetical protein [Hyphomonas johnsonii]|uniref:Uncharacterized protein n=1 Tax=Hyphomonas johnsonii MHS-2 TaxID=1280950 RepID=A0A059FFY8_9PROT|nr:hypothetical protein [Hyphomonas johnsonii]KCZ89471.1 hypothetical protein HJO_14672 [Hyphomonas johnsonii MHS-2]